MRIMGLDFGSKTVGVAISDPLLITAQGIEIIRRKEVLIQYIFQHHFAKFAAGIRSEFLINVGFSAISKIANTFDNN